MLAVDQAEEVFALCQDLEERRAFLERLTEEARQRPVLVTVRGDRLTQVTEHAGFSRLVEQGLYLVGALDEAGLREAVERPAYQAGLVIEPGLVELLVREVRDDPGALPLLSHALLETWQRREGNTLTVDGYHASGGIHGAVAQSAEHLYRQIEPDQRGQLRDLMLLLVSPGIGGEAVRTQVPRRLVSSDRHHEQLIEMLVAARLVTSDEGVLEVTHEALARAWPRLRGWLDDDVEGQQTRRHLSAAADAWDVLGRPESEFYRGVRLTRALEWQARTESALTDTEREFLAASKVASEVEERTAAERAAAQARLIRRLRIVLAGAAVALVLALVAGGTAAVQSDRAGRNAAEARDAAETARQAAVSADARRVGARAQLTNDTSLSLLLAVAGARLDDSAETRGNLLAALAERPTLVRSSPADGGFLETSERQSRRTLRRLLGRPAPDAPLRQPPPTGCSGATTPACRLETRWASMLGAFSPDSRRLAVISYSVESTEPVRLLDTGTMRPTPTALASPGGEPVIGLDVQFSADGRYLAATVHPDPWRQDARETQGYALVWDRTLPVQQPGPGADRNHGSGAGSQPGRPDPVHDLAADGVRRGDGRADLASRGRQVGVLGSRRQRRGHPARTRRRQDQRGRGRVPGGREDRTHGHATARTPGRWSSRPPVLAGRHARGVGLQDGELIVWDTATGLPRERWNTHAPVGRRLQPGQRPGLRRRRRLDAAHLGRRRQGHLPAADHHRRRRRGVRARGGVS